MPGSPVEPSRVESRLDRVSQNIFGIHLDKVGAVAPPGTEKHGDSE